MRQKELKRRIKGVFKQPKIVYYWGKLRHGTPYFWPRGFNRRIITVRRLIETPQEELDKIENAYTRKHKRFKNLPMVRRSKYWTLKILGRWYFIEIGWPFMIHRMWLGWKDKWETPRYEWPPGFQIFFFGLQFCKWWVSPDDDNDRYYEQILWYLEYSKENIHEARRSWPWRTIDKKESTWKDEYLI